MKKAMRLIADEVALELARELRSHQDVAEPASTSVDDQFISQLAQEVAKQLGNTSSITPVDRPDVAERLQRVEKTLEKFATGIQSAFQEDTISGPPAEVGEGAKYQNVDSLIKYIESSDGEGGIKLIIMNFND